MNKILTITLFLLLACSLQAQELGRSEQRKLDEATKNIEVAEKSNNSKDFKRAYKKVQSNLKSLKKKFSDHPSVKELEGKLEILDKIAIFEEFRSDAESAMDKLESIFKKIKTGKKTNEQEIEKLINEIQSNTLKLKNSEKQRFSNTIDAVSNILTQAKELGIKIKTQEEIEFQIALEKAIQQLNYGQNKSVKSLEKSLEMAKDSGNYDRLSSYMEQAKSDIEALNEVSDNLKVKTLVAEYEKQKPRIDVYKAVDDLDDIVRKMSSYVSELNKSVERALERLADAEFTKDANRVLVGSCGNTLNDAINNLLDAEQNQSANIKTIKEKKAFIETTKEENVEKMIFRVNEVLEKWDESFSHKDDIVKKSIFIAEKLTNDIKNEFAGFQKNIKEVTKEPKEFSESIRLFQDFLKMGLQDFTNKFEAVPDIAKLSVELVELEKTRESYIVFLKEMESIHNYLQYGNTEEYSKQHYEKANELKGEDENLQAMLTHYEELFGRWDKANKELVKIKERMTEKIIAASEATAKNGFQKFKNSWKQIEPNRLAILQNLEAYKGKMIVKGIVWQGLRGDGSYGWSLDHGDDRFVYVWDSIVYETIKPMWQEHENVFNNFRLEVLKKYNLPADNKGQVYWSFLGFENVDIVAVVNGTSSYRPKRTARDQYGNTITIEGDPIQIVQLRMVGFQSKHYTYWLDGVNMNSKLDFSDIVVK